MKRTNITINIIFFAPNTILNFSMVLLLLITTAIAQNNPVSVGLEIYVIGSNGNLTPSTTARPGQTVLYRLIAQNTGDTTLPNGAVTITGPIPEGTSYVFNSATQPPNALLETFDEFVRWTVDKDLVPNETIVFEYQVTVNGGVPNSSSSQSIASSSLTLGGTGDSTTRVFLTTSPWMFNFIGPEGSTFYLYNADEESSSKIIEQNQPIYDLGNLYIYVVALKDEPWRLTVQLNPASDNSSDTDLGFGIRRYTRASEINSATDLYNYSDFKDEPEAQAFFIAQGGPKFDPNDLDRDGDGYACEYDPRQTYRTNEPLQSSNLCSAGEHWVQPYTRKVGVQVKGHCRKN